MKKLPVMVSSGDGSFAAPIRWSLLSLAVLAGMASPALARERVFKISGSGDDPDVSPLKLFPSLNRKAVVQDSNP